MKWITFPIDIIRVVLCVVWTAAAGVLGLILRIFMSPAPAVSFVSRKFWSPFMLVFTLIRLKVKGRENIPLDFPCIYIANHQSLVDILVLSHSVTVPLFYVAKEELRKVPFVGHYIRVMGMIFIDRKNREKAMASMKTAIERIRSGYNVITFPEGTRGTNGKLLLFRRGTFIIAKEGMIPIVPVAIRNSWRVLPRGSFIPRAGTIEVIIGKPVMPEAFAHLQPEAIAAMFQQKMEEMLNGGGQGVG